MHRAFQESRTLSSSIGLPDLHLLEPSPEFSAAGQQKEEGASTHHPWESLTSAYIGQSRCHDRTENLGGKGSGVGWTHSRRQVKAAAHGEQTRPEFKRSEALEQEEAPQGRKRSKNRKQEGTGSMIGDGRDVLGHSRKHQDLRTFRQDGTKQHSRWGGENQGQSLEDPERMRYKSVVNDNDKHKTRCDPSIISRSDKTQLLRKVTNWEFRRV